MNIFDKFENLPKIVFTRPSEGDYYGFHFENILCESDYPTYHPESTLNNNKVRKNINIVQVNIFDQFKNLRKIVFTRKSESDYYGLYFENILCVCHFPTYYPKSTKNQGKMRKIYILF